MRYFDSRDTRLDLNHVVASGALPPAFAAVRIDGDPYWDSGIYSNTPIEAVLDDRPRRDSVIFTVNVWQPHGAEHNSISQALGRQKDIQFASRADSHIAQQKQIHRLRHVIRELAKKMPDNIQDSPDVKQLAGSRRETGYAETRRIIEVAPWTAPVDPIEGMVVHEHR